MLLKNSRRRLGAALLCGLALAAACDSTSPAIGVAPDAGIADGDSQDTAPPAIIDSGNDDAPQEAAVDAQGALLDAMSKARDTFNNVYCAAFAKYDPTFFAFTFGEITSVGMNTCKTAGALVAIPLRDVSYVNDLEAPYAYGSKLTPDALIACADALTTRLTSLDAWVKFVSEHDIPDACTPAYFGTLAAGEKCALWNQCASGRCLQPSESPQGSCGLCVPTKGEGKDCQPDECEAGLTCNLVTMKCTTFGVAALTADAGSACDVSTRVEGKAPLRVRGRVLARVSQRPCRDHLVCKAGTCVAEPAQCDSDDDCGAIPSLRHCNTMTKICEADAFATTQGAPCGNLTEGFRLCAHGLTCIRPDTSDAAVLDQCATVIDNNAVCKFNPDYDNHCKEPDSRCFHDKCQRNGTAECSGPTVLP